MLGLSRGIWTVVVLALLGGVAVAQDKGASELTATEEEAKQKASQEFDKAMEMMAYKQYERGLSMLNEVVRANQGNMLSHRANMAMGKHFLEQGKPQRALSYFILLTRVLEPVPGQNQNEERTEMFCDALYHAGLAQCRAGRFSQAFPLFRRLIDVTDKSEWADLAYFEIGNGHYNLKNWNKMIDALSMVGTVVEEDDAAAALNSIEIGQRFYARIADADIPVLLRLGRPIIAKVTVSSGDAEILKGVPVSGKPTEMMVSAPTELGHPKRGDGKLQILGGDTLTVTYLDDSTFAGKKNVARKGKVRAVSSGTIGFCLGDFETPAYIAYPGQLQPLLLRDADLDTSSKAEQVRVTVRSLYKDDDWTKTNEYEEGQHDVFQKEELEEEKWRERDSVTVILTEQGTGEDIRSGVFVGKVQLAAIEQGQSPKTDDNLLHCDELDELSVVYRDEVHLYGSEPRETEARIKVSGSVNSGVTADQYVVFETLLKARKACVEAKALVGLGKIYKDMGLESHAGRYAEDALRRVDPVILDRAKLPGDLVETAFKFKWESELLQDDFSGAASTCLAFNRIYPESVLADQALMTVGRSLTQAERYKQAITIYGQVLKLQNPISAAEAQFRIGETLVKKINAEAEAAYEATEQWGVSAEKAKGALLDSMEPAIDAFRTCFTTYPQSPYAAEALRNVLTHYVDNENYEHAATLLETIFTDYPDASFLDEMLLLWAKVAYKMNDAEMAKQKLRKLIFDYPQSGLVSDARQKLAALEARE